MPWLWISIPIEAVFLLACTMAPIWLGFRRPDRAPENARGHAAPRPAGRPNPAAAASAAESVRRAGIAAPRPLLETARR